MHPLFLPGRNLLSSKITFRCFALFSKKWLKIIGEKLDRTFLKRWRTFWKSPWCFDKNSLTNLSMCLDTFTCASRRVFASFSIEKYNTENAMSGFWGIILGWGSKVKYWFLLQYKQHKRMPFALWKSTIGCNIFNGSCV